MKKIFGWTMVVLLGFFLTGSPAWAKTISGKVTAINAQAGQLSVETVNPVTKMPESVSVSLNPLTIYSGVVSAAEIQAGDKVWIETASDSGPLAADSVKVSKG